MRGYRSVAGWCIGPIACLAALAGCLPASDSASQTPEQPAPAVENPSTPTTPEPPATTPTASIAGTIAVQQAAGQTAVFEREPNDTIEQAQLVGTAAPGDKYLVFGSVSALSDTFDAFEFTASQRVTVSFSLNYTTNDATRKNDFDVGVFDFKHSDCYPGDTGSPTFAQCFDSATQPETGTFDIDGPFVLVVVPYNGTGQYQFDVSVTQATSTTTQPAMSHTSAAKGPPSAISGASFGEVISPLVPDEILVTFDPAADETARTKALAASNLSLIEASPSGLCRARRIPDKNLTTRQRSALTCTAARCVAAQPGVLSASPNYTRSIALTPNDEHYNLQWHYPLINLPQAWDTTTGSDDIVVAVIDTGILSHHPDIEGRLTGDGYDFISDLGSARDGDGRDSDPEDPGDLFGGPGQSSFHGTHVAGTIGARSNNGIGVVGITWAGKIMPLRAVGVGGGSDFDISEAVRYAAGLTNISGRVPAKPAKIINMSLSGGAGSPASDGLHSAIQAASAAGALIVAATGNEGSSLPSYPAAFDEVVSVGAVDLAMQRAPYSNYGSWLDIAAPGGNVGTDLNGDGWADGILSTGASDLGGQIAYQYRLENGTSMAAPHVAGVAALVLAANPALSAGQVRDILQTTARDLGTLGRDDAYGFGLIDAAAAVQEARRRAGGVASTTPQLTVSTSTLDFGATDIVLRVAVSNTGGGTLTITNVAATTFNGDGWLSAYSEGRGTNTNATQVVVSVNRTDLPEASYRGRVTIDATGLPSQTIEVRMTVGSGGSTEEPIYILVVDPATFDTIGEAETDASNGFAYIVRDLPAGQYVVYAGTDRDKNGYICEMGDLCGALPSTIEPTVVQLSVGEALTGADFAIALQVIQQASASDAIRPPLRRQMK